MALSTPAAPLPPPTGSHEGYEVPSEPIWRLTVSHYHEMVRQGILTEDDPVELLEGWLVTKMSKNPPHSVATRLARACLTRAVPAGWYVDSQEPVTTSDSEPEPDVMVIRGDVRDYSDRHPGPADAALVVEVADATLARDRGIKKRLYARAGVAVYWIVNLIDRVVEVYSDPTGPADQPDYRRRSEHGEQGSVTVTIEGREVATIAVRDLLP